MSMSKKEMRRFKAHAQHHQNTDALFSLNYTQTHLNPELSKRKVKIELTGAEAMSMFCGHATLMEFIDTNFSAPAEVNKVLDQAEDAFKKFAEQMLPQIGVQLDVADEQ